MDEPQEPRVEYFPYGKASLRELLGLRNQSFVRDAFRQLEYIERYLGHAELACQSLVIERHYIDRDYIEDYSIFYSRSLYPYKNYCQRVHFFSIEEKELKRELRRLVTIGEVKEEEVFKEACREFSQRAYLGFSVIKPLDGCPVGRTVLKLLGKDAKNGLIRQYQSTRGYKVHLAGVELTVRGLAFQQQDVGVSACATTAIWTALHKARDLERMGAPTPAQITQLASRHALPFGRAMPSEGLSIDQMCQAIQAVGVSPNLIRAEDFETAQGYLYSATASGFAPVLILSTKVRNLQLFHAVTVTGMKVQASHVPSPIPQYNNIDDKAGDLVSLFVHDDRHGPYLRTDIEPEGGKLALNIDLRGGNNNGQEKWLLTHILVPMHAKIRLSFGVLRDIAIEVVKDVEALRLAYLDKQEKPVGIKNPSVLFETLIMRAYLYTEEIFIGNQRLRKSKLEEFASKIQLSRYVGVVRISGSYFGSIDILIDTTSTPRNIHCLGVVIKNRSKYTDLLGEFLSLSYDCPLIQ